MGLGRVNSGSMGLGRRRALALQPQRVSLRIGRLIAPPVKGQQLLLAQQGVTLMELVNLEELARDRIYEFAFVSGSLRLRGASAAPTRARCCGSASSPTMRWPRTPWSSCACSSR